MIVLTENHQKVYLKITSLIKKYSKLSKDVGKILTENGEVKEDFYGNYLNKSYLHSNFVSTLGFALVCYLMHLVFLIIVSPKTQEYFMTLIGIPSLSLLTFISLNIYTYFKNRGHYITSKKLSFDISKDEDLKNIFWKSDLGSYKYVIEDLPENKRNVFSGLKKLTNSLEKDGFYEKIGAKEDENLKKLLRQYKQIKSNIQEYDATDTHKNYWTEKLNEFVKENSKYKKYFN